MLPSAVILLLIIATLAGAAATAATTGNSQSNRDRSVKRAVAAIDAGLGVATYRLNKLQPPDQQCVVVDANGDLQLAGLDPDGWCPAQTEDLGGGATYSYRVSAGQQVSVNGQSLVQRKIVSTGVVNGVQRRALVTVGSSSGTPLFAGNAVTSIGPLEIENGATVTGDVASNGNITVKNSAQLCGNAAPGPGQQFITKNSGWQCPGYSATPASQDIVLNPVDQGDAPTVNDNARIGVQDPWTLPSEIGWDPGTRVLRLRNGATLTLTGNVYSFCELEITNSAQLIIGARSPSLPLKIYIDAPENCTSGSGSVTAKNSGQIVNVNSSPVTLQLFVVGSPNVETKVDFKNSFSSEVAMVIYAPYSEVEIKNSASIRGAVAAKEVEVENSASITWASEVASISETNVLPLFQRQSWTECTPASGDSTPDGGC